MKQSPLRVGAASSLAATSWFIFIAVSAASHGPARGEGKINPANRLQVSVQDAQAVPQVFMPDVDWTNFSGRMIIDAY